MAVSPLRWAALMRMPVLSSGPKRRAMSVDTWNWPPLDTPVVMRLTYATGTPLESEHDVVVQGTLEKPSVAETMIFLRAGQPDQQKEIEQQRLLGGGDDVDEAETDRQAKPADPDGNRLGRQVPAGHRVDLGNLCHEGTPCVHGTYLTREPAGVAKEPRRRGGRFEPAGIENQRPSPVIGNSRKASPCFGYCPCCCSPPPRARPT